MFSLYHVAFVPARKSYRTGLLFTHKNGDFSAIALMAHEKYLRQLRYCPPPPLRDGMLINPTDSPLSRYIFGTH